MKKTITGIMGASALMVATIVSAQAQGPAVPNTSQTTAAPVPAQNPQGTVQQSVPLFTIAGVPVRVWAPIEPSYDPNMNRTAAEGPMWDAGGP
jgi:hypothetical protein